jgi:hypothetical protein
MLSNLLLMNLIKFDLNMKKFSQKTSLKIIAIIYSRSLNLLTQLFKHLEKHIKN